MIDKPNDLYLYTLVRTDMQSLGRGKGTAQAAHAANQFTDDHIIQPLLNGVAPSEDVMAWRAQANGFGTTIALAARLFEMDKAVKLASAIGAKASLVKDPEYPLVDGDTFHIIPNVVTTAYIFGDKTTLRMILGDLKLLSNDPVPA